MSPRPRYPRTVDTARQIAMLCGIMIAFMFLEGYPSLLILLALSALWVVQFVQLMVLSDSDFPGRYDKTLWVVAFVIVAPLAPFAFLLWKGAMTQLRERKR